mmetsp:Transcript_34665/g.76237  ORF Transcript_34665/g.76237 Transcript_34665/m.76237 type:complete len:237 (-) Transcript_34665:619-1329(-)
METGARRRLPRAAVFVPLLRAHRHRLAARRDGARDDPLRDGDHPLHGPRRGHRLFPRLLRAHHARRRLCVWRALLALGRDVLDPDYGLHVRALSEHHLGAHAHAQYGGLFLPVARRDWLHLGGLGRAHLAAARVPALRPRHHRRTQLERHLQRAVQGELDPAPHPREALVRAAGRAHRPRRRAALRLHLHRDVLRLHLLLELQVLLRLRLHAPRVHDLGGGDGLRHDRRHLLSAQQ